MDVGGVRSIGSFGRGLRPYLVAAGELVGEEHVEELRVRINLHPAAVALLHVQVVQVDFPQVVRLRCHLVSLRVCVSVFGMS